MPGHKSLEIIAGDYIVEHMHGKNFGFGEIDTKCRHWQAMKFKKETPGLCCKVGKVQLAPFPLPPQDMHHYWFANTDLALLFRDNSRIFNNALCLATLSMQRPQYLQQGFQPMIVLSGQLMEYFAPLEAEPGEPPQCAQLYLIDHSLERSK